MKYHWILDNGHGFDTRGKRSPKWGDGMQMLEYEFNRSIVLGISCVLDAIGVSNQILVPEIEDISLRRRRSMINSIAASNMKPCVLISIHANGYRKERAHGFEVYTWPGESHSDEIADLYLKHSALNLFRYGVSFRKDYSDGDGDKEKRFHILGCRPPAILTENGFMTNEKECRLLVNQEVRKRIITSHIDMIKEYEKII